MRNILALRVTCKEWPLLVCRPSDPSCCFSGLGLKNSTPAWLVGVHTSALNLCDILAVKSHIWLIIVIISQWDGWAVQGIIAASHCSRYSHLGVPHSPAVEGWKEMGRWGGLVTVGGASEAHICPPQLDMEARGQAMTLVVQRTGTPSQMGYLSHAPQLQTSSKAAVESGRWTGGKVEERKRVVEF